MTTPTAPASTSSPISTPAQSAGTATLTSDAAALRQLLVDDGVELVADDGQTVVAGPADAAIVLPDSVIPTIAAQAAAGTGRPGIVLDQLGGGAPTQLPPSALLAAYARGVDTPGAAFVRKLLAGQDLTHPQDVIFPTAVPLLFAADAVHEIAGPTARLSPNARLAAFRPCSAFTDIVFGSVNKVFDALHIPPGRVGATGSKFLDGILQGLTDVVIAGLNIVVESARTLVINGIRLLFADLVDLIAKAATIMELVASVVANVDPIRLIILPDQPSTRRGVDTEVVSDTVTVSAHLLSEQLDWPDWLQDCANTSLGHPLPSMNPAGSQVIWTIAEIKGSPLAHRGASGTDDTLQRVSGADSQARLVLEMATESADTAARGAPQDGIVRVDVRVHRAALADVQSSLVDLAKSAAGTLTSKLPQPFKGYVDGLLAGAVTAATNGFGSLLDSTGYTLITVAYHDLPEPSPSPVASASASPDQGIAGTWRGAWASETYAGLTGGFVLKFVQKGTSLSGTISISGTPCISGARITGTLVGRTIKFGAVEGAETIAYEGLYSGNALQGTWQVTAPSGGQCTNDHGTWQAAR